MADVFLLLGSCPRRLATISRQPLTAGFSWYFLQLFVSRLNSLTAASRLSPLTGSTGARYIASGWTAQETPLPTALLLLCVQLILRSHDDYQPFPSNGRLCWFHSSYFEKICHNMLGGWKYGLHSSRSTLLQGCPTCSMSVAVGFV
jgi:hypothetical protein